MRSTSSVAGALARGLWRFLLGYYPNYVLLSYSALAQIASTLTDSAVATVICGGPVPEVVALSALLHQHHSLGSQLRVNYVDRAHLWGWGADLSVGVARRLTPGVGIALTRAAVDISEPFEARVSLALAESDVYVFQNCLNEIWPSQAVADNIIGMGLAAKEDAFFVFVDQAKYGVTYEAMTYLRDRFLREGFTLVEDCSADWMLNLRFFNSGSAENEVLRPRAATERKWEMAGAISPDCRQRAFAYSSEESWLQ